MNFEPRHVRRAPVSESFDYLAADQPDYMKYLPLDPNLFINNRKRFVSQLLPNSIAVFVSNDEWPANGDALHPFKQNSDLFWLSGINQEDSMVILFPDNPDPKFREVLV